MKTITLLPGDGSGSRVVAAAFARVLAAGVRTRAIAGVAFATEPTEAIVGAIERR